MKQSKLESHKGALATMLKALGEPKRLDIYLCLLDHESISFGKEGEITPNGVSVGDVCCQVTGCQKVSSTLSHHVKELRLAGLVDVQRQGRRMVCKLNRESLNLLAEFGIHLGRSQNGQGDDIEFKS